MDGFVHALAAPVERGGRQHANGAGQHGRCIRENIAEHVAGYHHIKLLRFTHQLHGCIVNVHMTEFDITVFISQADHDIAPEF